MAPVSNEFVPFRARAIETFGGHAAEMSYLRDSLIASHRRFVWLQDTMIHLFRVVRECFAVVSSMSHVDPQTGGLAPEHPHLAHVGGLLYSIARESNRWPLTPARYPNGTASTTPLTQPNRRFPPSDVERRLERAGPILVTDVLGFGDLSGSEDEDFGEPEAQAPLHATMSPSRRAGPSMLGGTAAVDGARAGLRDAEMGEAAPVVVDEGVEVGVAGLSIADVAVEVDMDVDGGGAEMGDVEDTDGFADDGENGGDVGAREDEAVEDAREDKGVEDVGGEDTACSDVEERGRAGLAQGSTPRLPADAFSHRPRLPSRSARRHGKRKEQRGEGSGKKHRR